MTAYTGISTGTIIAEDAWRPCVSINISSVASVSPVSEMYELESVLSLDAGVYNQESPIEELEQSYVGTKVDSFLDDYYYRIHLIESTINFGIVIDPQDETFILWNAYFVSKVCSAIIEENGEQFTLTGETAPFILSPLGYEIYTLTVPREGEAEFEGSITFVFPDESPILTLSATRMIIFPFEPLVPMTETLEWATNVIKARDGSEQRMSIRPIPRQSFKIDVFLKDEQVQSALDAMLFTWQKIAWGLPIWGEWTQHLSTITAGDFTITLDTENADYRDDSLAVIWKDWDDYEVIKISTVTSTTLTLGTAVANTWTGLKWIMPLRHTYMYSQATRKGEPGKVGGGSFTFLVKDNVLLTGYSPDVSYKDLPVLPSPLVEDEQEIEIDADAVITDSITGDFLMHSDSTYNIYTQPHKFRNISKEECWNFRKFLHSLFGKRNTFWVISDKEDMVQTETIGAADTSFRIESKGWGRYVGSNSLRTDLAFIFPDGTILYREMTGLVEAEDNEDIVSIDSPLGVEVHIGDCQISFLDKCRLTEDKIDLIWEECFRNTCEVNLTRVPE